MGPLGQGAGRRGTGRQASEGEVGVTALDSSGVVGLVGGSLAQRRRRKHTRARLNPASLFPLQRDRQAEGGGDGPDELHAALSALGSSPTPSTAPPSLDGPAGPGSARVPSHLPSPRAALGSRRAGPTGSRRETRVDGGLWVSFRTFPRLALPLVFIYRRRRRAVDHLVLHVRLRPPTTKDAQGS